MTKKIDVRQYKKNGKQFGYILDNMLSGENYEGLSDCDKIITFYKQFNNEYNCDYYCREYPRLSDRISNYLQGLPSGVNIAYTYYDISITLQEMGVKLTLDKSGDWDNRSWNIIQNWFNVIGQHIVFLMEYYNFDIRTAYNIRNGYQYVFTRPQTEKEKEITNYAHGRQLLNDDAIKIILDFYTVENEPLHSHKHFDFGGRVFVASVEGLKMWDNVERDFNEANEIGCGDDWRKYNVDGWDVYQYRGDIGLLWYCNNNGTVIYISLEK